MKVYLLDRQIGTFANAVSVCECGVIAYDVNIKGLGVRSLCSKLFRINNNNLHVLEMYEDLMYTYMLNQYTVQLKELTAKAHNN